MELLYVDPDAAARATVSEAFGTGGTTVEEVDGSTAEVAEGTTVEAVESRAAAVATLRDGGVDCLVCEHDLPDGDARALLAAARELAPSVPVVVYTDAGDGALAGELLAAGVDGYVPKREGVDVLVERVLAAIPDPSTAERSSGTGGSAGAAATGGAVGDAVTGGDTTGDATGDDAGAGGDRAGGDTTGDATDDSDTTDGDADGDDATGDATGGGDAAAPVVEQAPIGIVELDREFRVVGWNPGAVELFGYAREEALGRHPWEFVIPASDREAVRAALRRLRDDREPVNNVNENLHADGTRITCEWHNAPLVEDGDVVGVLAFAHDVTEETRRVERLEALQETSRALMRADSREAVAREVVEAAESVLGQPSATVRLYDPDADALEAVAATDRVRETTGPLSELPAVGPGDGAFWTVYETGERAFLDNAAEGVDAYDDEEFEQTVGLLVEPLGEHGVLAFSTWEVDGFDDADAHVSRILATTATAAMDNAARTRELERYETIVRAVGDGVFVIDDDGHYAQVNERLAEVAGYDREDLIGAPASRLHDDEDLAHAREQVRRLVDGDATVVTYEIDLLTADGERRPLEVSQSLLPGESFSGTVGTARLIERRKRVERELRRRKRKTEHLHGVSTRLQECDAVEEVCRVAVEAAREILELADCSVRLLEDGELVLAPASAPGKLRDRLPVEGTVAGRTVREAETRVIDDVEAVQLDAESNPHGYRSVLSVPLGDHGVFQGAATEASAYDAEAVELAELLAAHVTHALDRVEFEAELRAERDRLAALFDNVPDPVVSVRHTDRGGIVQAVNPAFERVFGYDAAELEGELLGEYIVPPDCRAAARELAAAATEGEVVEAEVQRRTAHGLREFELTIVPVDLGEASPATFGVYADVTERKQRRRRVEVLNRVLRHDLRNGMNIVRGAAELLADRVGDAEAIDHAESIVDRADELLALADRTRAVERTLDHGQRDRREPVNLAAVVRESVETVRADHPDAEFSVSGPDRAPVAGSDLLELAVRDVVENAVVHNDREQPSVTVALERAGDAVHLRVADDGPGIPEEERRLLVGDQEITQLRHASGLGLWLANWAVTHAGGELRFADNDPRGSVVEMELPAVADPRLLSSAESER